MKSCGIVVEYNPFHNGHLYHLHKAKEATKADVVIAVMSGNFLQRGEPALVSKYFRTKMALENGVDIVVELPYAFATQRADIFAKGAIDILNSLRCSYLCFGSESGHIEQFLKTYDLMQEKENEYNQFVKLFMKEGFSYPEATSRAFKNILYENHLLDLSKPNNILGYHYIKAMKDLHSDMEPVTIKRVNSGYHDISLSPSNISSATSIREALFETKRLEAIKKQVPLESYNLLVHYHEKFHTFVRWENLWPYLKYRILQSEPEELKEIYEIEEGLENRFIRFAKDSITFHEFMEKVKTKRYTWTRLQRACVHLLTNSRKTMMHKRSKRAEYIRLLGFTKKGRAYIRQNKDHFTLPIISKLSQADREIIRLDVKASHIYSFAFQTEIGQQVINEEFQQPPIIK
ncbi:nucleotidyltransferase [Caldibacillus thermolactis]|uniref:tRNA(Met) cytidine acetate ligase n=2 Tax=Pallidibacillus thermolactis TaxID=251051 RepID=A0ABT2WHV6_9BACI|nr:nucleotidyltransferase [Pallidibacillus thermolactis]MCU9595046.1 nucleotidyltransferase [Pallidibacillus thermolactis]MCU9600363.1 nucleotidyltransferase [Pallidibacillus thermolactis subsp. kokeshiiformis]